MAAKEPVMSIRMWAERLETPFELPTDNENYRLVTEKEFKKLVGSANSER